MGSYRNQKMRDRILDDIGSLSDVAGFRLQVIVDRIKAVVMEEETFDIFDMKSWLQRRCYQVICGYGRLAVVCVCVCVWWK